jgi:putative colanic acid biosynthesis acetyltransferase WcaF
VEIPWNLQVGAGTIIGDEVILYCLGLVTIGARVTISQYSHLCAGTHDFTRRDFPLLRVPIEIGDEVWIATDVFVGPGVKIGPGAVVGARSSVFQDLPAWQICVGTPARAIKERVIVDAPALSLDLPQEQVGAP